MVVISLVLSINPLEARVSRVSYINILMYHLPHALNYLVRHNLNTFGVQLGAHQIINWCAPIIYLNYLVSVKSFGAHKIIS